MNTTTPWLSLVITTRNRIADLERCVESVRRSEWQGMDWELIIVDDASTDATSTLADGAFGLVHSRVIHNPGQLMMVKTRNVGARAARGKYILFVDDDNELDPAMIPELTAFAEAHPGYGIVGPAMFYAMPRQKYLDYQRISLWTGHTRGIIDDSDRAWCDSDGIPNVFLIRAEVFAKAGYFDDALIQTYTEPDFAFTAATYGFRCGIVKAARTYHKVSSADRFTSRVLGGAFAQKAYCLMRNRSVLVVRYGTGWQRAVYFLCFAWIWPTIYTALTLKHRRFDLIRFYWCGFLDGFRYWHTGHLANSLNRLM